MERNPYSITFGQIPEELVARLQLIDTVMNSFIHDNPRQQVYMVSGIRGSGKTVFMTKVAREIAGQPEWIHVDLNSEGDLLADLHARLAAEHLLDAMKRAHKKLLITVDEVVVTKEIRLFCSEFQRYLRQDLPVYLLMTGLYKNINALKNEKSLTFLYRAPQIMMDPLNIGAIATNYKKNMHLTDEQVVEMARMTKGYSFAFQVLGSLTWNAHGDYKEVVPLFRQYLEEYSYEKIWSELSDADQDILIAMTELFIERREESFKVADIREKTGSKSNLFNQYRTKLLRQGVVDSPKYGYLGFALPMFAEFVADNNL